MARINNETGEEYVLEGDEPLSQPAGNLPLTEPTPAGETLESFGAKVAEQNGYDPTSPSTQQGIQRGVQLARNQMPGKSDDEIIAEIKKAGPAMVDKLLPRFQQLPGFDASKYQTLQTNFNKEFGGDAEVANRQKLRDRDVFADAGRAISSAARINAGPEYQGILNDQYNSTKAANKEEIIGDWEVRRKAKVAEMEQMIKNGAINRQQVQDETNMFALEQLRTESATKEAAFKAANDPNSLVSQGARHLAEMAYPKLADKLKTMSKAEIVAALPGIEKRIEAEEKKGLEEWKAKNKASENALDRQNRVDVANIRAKKGSGEGGAAAPKAGDLIRVEAEGAKLDKQSREVQEKKAAAQESIVLFDELGDLVNKGLTTGPIMGGDNILSKTADVFSKDRQRAKQIGAQLVATMAKTFGAAPSDAENRLIREANTIMQQDDPAPALQALRAKYERQVALRDQELAEIEARKGSLGAAVGNKPALPAPASSRTPVPTKDLPRKNNKGWELHTDGSGNRAYVSPDGKQYEEVK